MKNKITENELQRVAEILSVQYNAEFIGMVDGESITLAFDTIDSMMRLIGDVKHVKPALPRVSFNSKQIDGRHIVTVTGIRGHLHP
jgi:hypothetical protein